MTRVLTLLIVLIGMISLSLSASALEAQDVRVVGLFKGAAVLEIGGKQRLLKAGKASPEGVKLLSADAVGATVMIDGIQHQLNLTRSHSGGYQERNTVSQQIDINERGQYITPGSINGRSVRFLVDTGATSVAMNSEMARSLGVDFASGKIGQSNTAGGLVKSYVVTLDRVKVGGIEVRNVRAAILEGVYPTHVLLGMTYLSAVEMNENSGLMTLTKKY
ncbi:MAG: TIGR02281 family clan AA aspartic protease [Pseudomonadales bacterium]